MVWSFFIAHAQVKIGIIGLDTSHSTTFTKMLNNEDKKEEFKDFRVVAAYSHEAKTIKLCYERIPGYIEQLEKLDVEIVSSIAEFLDKVDCVLLETNDGNLHLEKIMFINRLIGAKLAQSIAIFELS